MARATQGLEKDVIMVYGYSPSGNCHKLRMLLGHLGRVEGRDFRWIETDSAQGATRTPEYLAKNPNGRVPMIELDDGRILAESNAILCWLAEGTPYFSGDSWQRAHTLAWMFFEQYSHEPSRLRVSSAAGRPAIRRAAPICRNCANAVIRRWR